MNALLICPSSRPAVQQLARPAPLAALPLLGQSLVEYWLAHLAANGAREVCILADDRPEQIAALADNGTRWGLRAEVIAEGRELTPAQAELKYAREFAAAKGKIEIAVLDHFPGISRPLLFTGYAALFAGLIEWMSRASTPDRVGIRQIRPGVWLGMHSHVSERAELQAPCWIGQNVYVGAGAEIGPQTVIEDRAFVESGAEIRGSIIGPDTFVGQFAEIHQSFAWGSTLLNWKTGSSVEITDSFLLCGLRRSAPPHQPESLLGRLAELYLRKKRSVSALPEISGEQRGIA